MRVGLFSKKAVSTAEYASRLILVMGALLYFQKYIIQGFEGRWKKMGDTYGYEKQYDRQPYGTRGDGGGTLSCFFDNSYVSGTWVAQWVDDDCFKQNCVDYCTNPVAASQCTTCKQVTCYVPDCQ